ncbi:SLATT domain-containing protein [Pseudomonas sp. NPDC089530]|uniref:SLATT domain-containing protein n=1 Tax=Pseudomonas sp. NPDC089530 TaxID=3390651 RepID=UPI003D07795A
MSLSDKIWWTRKSRIQTEKRLLSNNFQAQIILLWYALFSVAVSIYYLIQKSSSDIAPGIWVILSVFSLTASTFVSALDFKSRASLVKECYEYLDTLYNLSKNTTDLEKIQNIQTKYNKTLALCENHTEFDYRAARCEMHFSGNKNFSPAITKYEIFIWAASKFSKFLFLIIIYASPAALFLVLEVNNACSR